MNNTYGKETHTEEILRKQRVQRIVVKIVTYTFLTVFAIFMLIPFYWMLNTALKSATEVDLYPPTLFPRQLMWGNFAEALERANLTRYFLNTIIVAVGSTVLGTFASIFLAYPLARLNFKGREVVFTVLLATMMIPGEMMVITNYITVSNLGWVDTALGSRVPYGPYYAMIIPFLVSVFHVYLLRQTFKQVPSELYYAAKVDGTSDWKYLWKVMVPLAKQSIITIVILKLMGAWNSYVWPNLVASQDFQLVTNGLRNAFTNSDTGRTEFQLQMAATVLVTLPLLITFIVFRKYIMRGVSRSGIKG
jgi:multiple sugar transport system permease protein